MYIQFTNGKCNHTFNVDLNISLDKEVIFSPEENEYIICFTLIPSDETAGLLEYLDRLNHNVELPGFDKVFLSDDLVSVSVKQACMYFTRKHGMYFVELRALGKYGEIEEKELITYVC